MRIDNWIDDDLDIDLSNVVISEKKAEAVVISGSKQLSKYFIIVNRRKRIVEALDMPSNTLVHSKPRNNNGSIEQTNWCCEF